MGNLARVIIASEPVYQIDRPLRASTLYAKVLAISGFMSAKTPTAVRPQHYAPRSRPS